MSHSMEPKLWVVTNISETTHELDGLGRLEPGESLKVLRTPYQIAANLELSALAAAAAIIIQLDEGQANPSIDELTITTTGGLTRKVIYVRTTGSDTKGDGSLASPYRTLVHALKTIPVFLPQNTRFVVDITGITETLPENYSSPMFLGGSRSVLNTSEPSLGYQMRIEAPITIRAIPQIVETISTEALSVTKDSIHEGETFTWAGTPFAGKDYALMQQSWIGAPYDGVTYYAPIVKQADDSLSVMSYGMLYQGGPYTVNTVGATLVIPSSGVSFSTMCNLAFSGIGFDTQNVNAPVTIQTINTASVAVCTGAIKLNTGSGVIASPSDAYTEQGVNDESLVATSHVWLKLGRGTAALCHESQLRLTVEVGAGCAYRCEQVYLNGDSFGGDGKGTNCSFDFKRCEQTSQSSSVYGGIVMTGGRGSVFKHKLRGVYGAPGGLEAAIEVSGTSFFTGSQITFDPAGVPNGQTPHASFITVGGGAQAELSFLTGCDDLNVNVGSETPKTVAEARIDGSTVDASEFCRLKVT